ncbi:MAG TPA: hypothetical protein PK530_13245, partial [Anaerolineales bacterium]|nr:hypothetical protein [Anaerolineales bacterium]
MAKISYRLWMLFDIQQNAPEINEAEVARQLSLPPDGPGSLYKNEKGDYLVYIRLAEITPETLASLAATGVKIEDIAEAYRTITAWLKLDQLPALAALSTVENVEEELRPFTSQIPSSFSASEETPTDCNSIISEGDSHLRADEARAAFNLDGTGVTIGILSDSFDQDTNAVTHASDDILSGDLPGPGNPCGHLTAVEVITTGLHGGHDEGRGMLQLVHDLAPGATLKFASGNGIYEFGTNIENLRAAGADILADDVAYANEPWFQAGPNGVAISNVVGSGAFYFTAAGNSNLLLPNGNEAGSYEAPAYRPIACPANLPAVETSCHNFYPGPGSVDDPSDTITLISGGSFVAALQWAQPWYGITTDLDFFLLDANGNVVASAVHTNAGVNGSQKPFELIFYTNNTGSTQTYDLVVARANVGDALSPRIKFIFLVSNGGITDVEYHVSNLGDIIGPTIFGHSGAEDAFSVAAMAYDQYGNVEHYSSRGPVTYYFAPATDTNPALPLAIPHVINKPDFTATDGGRTTFFGSNYG